MKILVTGATGFVGRTLCTMLNGFGDICAALWHENEASDLQAHVSFVVVGSIDRFTDWRQALNNVDVVIHLAARVHIMSDKAKNPLLEYREVNTYGTENLARQSAAAGVKRLVYISTIKVNGEHTDPGMAFTEMNSPNAHDPYAISKLEAERALKGISKESGLEVVIVRPPIIYGPGVGANFLSLMKLVDRGVPLPTRSIVNKRSLLCVRNLADFLVYCIEETAAANQVFLLSDGIAISTTELISEIAHALRKPDRQFAFPRVLAKAGSSLLMRKGLYSRLWGSLELDSSKAFQLLGWRPPYSFVECIQTTADWYRR